MKAPDFDYACPQTLEEALALIAQRQIGEVGEEQVELLADGLAARPSH